MEKFKKFSIKTLEKEFIQGGNYIPPSIGGDIDTGDCFPTQRTVQTFKTTSTTVNDQEPDSRCWPPY